MSQSTISRPKLTSRKPVLVSWNEPAATPVTYPRRLNAASSMDVEILIWSSVSCTSEIMIDPSQLTDHTARPSYGHKAADAPYPIRYPHSTLLHRNRQKQ